MLTMNPAGITIQIPLGSKNGGMDAYRFSALKHADLDGLSPSDKYEEQPNCVMVGCSTIHPSGWSLVLLVTTQLQSMDSAWESCDIGLQRLCDHPVPLTTQAAMTIPTTAVPQMSPAASLTQTATATVKTPHPAPTGALGHAPETSVAIIASVLVSALGADTLQAESITSV